MELPQRQPWAISRLSAQVFSFSAEYWHMEPSFRFAAFPLLENFAVRAAIRMIRLLGQELSCLYLVPG
jgi:hypothetical protein